MKTKIKLKFYVIFCISLSISSAETLPTEEVNKNGLNSTAIIEENQCDLYTYKMVKPLLVNLEVIQNKLKSQDSLIESKDREIIELKEKLSEKDKALEGCKKLDASNTAQIESLREIIRQLTKAFESTKHASDQLAELNRTIAAHSESIKEQNGQIIKFQAQIDLDNAKLQKSADQLANSLDLIRVKDEIIINQVKNISFIANKTQFELEQFKQSNFEGRVDSCLPFANPGIHTIKVAGLDPFNVLCQSTAKGPGWIVIQQRINGRENFYRNWTTYQAGFGSLNGDFFLGLEKIHRLTSNRRHELYIHLERFNGEIIYVTYNKFFITSEKDQYSLIFVDGFSANTNNTHDGMRANKGREFYTFDRDDVFDHAKVYQGGWWYNSFGESNLNGIYFDHQVWNKTSNFWCTFESVKKSQMLIRPKLD